jgi:AraC family transcriptional regulator
MSATLPEERVFYLGTTLYVGEYRCQAPAGRSRHEEATFEHEIVFPRSGVYVRETPRGQTVADANHVVFFTRGEAYTISHPVEGGDDSTVLRVGTLDLLDSAAAHDEAARDAPDDPFRARHCLRTPRASLLHFHLLNRARRGAPEIELRELAFDVLDEVFSGMCGGVPNRARATSRQREVVEAAQVLLAECRHEPLGLDDVARAIGYSPYYLSRLFRRETGLPIHRYLTRLRLGAALERLAEGERDITRLALEMGFADHSHFTTSFRREFGVPPSAFRRGCGV